MSESQTQTTPKVVRIGPDRVTIQGSEVVIQAKHRMPDWTVREINPEPIYFQENKFYLIQTRKGQGGYEVAYVLHPWPRDLSSTAKRFFSYDAEAVAERESGIRGGYLEMVTRALLTPFYPFLGFFWSGAQRWFSRFGFEPHSISGISIFMVFGMIFTQGIFAIVTINGSIKSGKLMIGGFIRAMSGRSDLQFGSFSLPIAWLDCLLMALLFVDLSMRYTYYMREHDWCGGFLEWLVRRPGQKTSAA
jgi:hypothetical protein